MIFIDLNNKNKNFCKKVIAIARKSKEEIIINSKFPDIDYKNIKMKKINDDYELVNIAKNAEIVLIFNVNDYKKYLNYSNKIIMVYDSKQEFIINRKKNNFIEFKDINNINNLDDIIRRNNFNIFRKKINLLLLIFLLIIIFGLNVLLISSEQSINNLSKENKKIEKKIDKLNKNYTNYLFLGDSITDYYDIEKYFNGYKVVNSGISGNQTIDIYDDLKNRAYIYNPSTIFLLIGTNDIEHGRSSSEIISSIKDIIFEINNNLPNAKIYLESIYPINNTDDNKINKSMVGKRTNEKINEINNEIKKYCNKKNCTYINFYDLLKDDDGNLKLDYTTDGLHISNDGYEIITKKLKKYMNK